VLFRKAVGDHDAAEAQDLPDQLGGDHRRGAPSRSSARCAGCACSPVPMVSYSSAPDVSPPSPLGQPSISTPCFPTAGPPTGTWMSPQETRPVSRRVGRTCRGSAAGQPPRAARRGFSAADQRRALGGGRRLRCRGGEEVRQVVGDGGDGGLLPEEGGGEAAAEAFL